MVVQALRHQGISSRPCPGQVHGRPLPARQRGAGGAGAGGGCLSPARRWKPPSPPGAGTRRPGLCRAPPPPQRCRTRSRQNRDAVPRPPGKIRLGARRPVGLEGCPRPAALPEPARGQRHAARRGLPEAPPPARRHLAAPQGGASPPRPPRGRCPMGTAAERGPAHRSADWLPVTGLSGGAAGVGERWRSCARAALRQPSCRGSSSCALGAAWAASSRALSSRRSGRTTRATWPPPSV